MATANRSYHAIAIALWALAAVGCEPQALDSPLCRADPPEVETSSQPEIWSMRRLGRDELARTFEALIEASPQALNQLPQDDPDLAAVAPAPSGFEVELYGHIANEAAELGVPVLLSRWDCGRGIRCLRAAAIEWVERAYRTPLEPAERAAYAALLATGVDPRPALRELLRLVFQSPRFLYVIERGRAIEGEPDRRALTPIELANRLSYFLWGAPPDDALWRDAASGRLAEPDVLNAHARRLIRADRGAETIGHLLQTWAAPELDVMAKSHVVYPEFDRALRASMTEQFTRFAAMAIDDDLSLRALLTTRRAPLDARLSELLGLPPVRGWQVRELEQPRFGVLTLPGVLASHARADDSSPVQRGLFIRQNVLCQTVPPPPPGVATLPPAGGTARNFRERFEEHTRNAACAGCHALMDPLGFPFEIYDGLGRLRPLDGEDTGGKLDGIAAPVEFADLPGLVDALAAAPEVSRCWAEQWLQRGLGPEGGTDATLVEALTAQVEGGASLTELLVEIVSAPAFLQVRRPAGG